MLSTFILVWQCDRKIIELRLNFLPHKRPGRRVLQIWVSSNYLKLRRYRSWICFWLLALDRSLQRVVLIFSGKMPGSIWIMWVSPLASWLFSYSNQSLRAPSLVALQWILYFFSACGSWAFTESLIIFTNRSYFLCSIRPSSQSTSLRRSPSKAWFCCEFDFSFTLQLYQDLITWSVFSSSFLHADNRLLKIIRRWFMPINIFLTSVIGSGLGWILMRITRAPAHFQGIILGSCAAGNIELISFLSASFKRDHALVRNYYFFIWSGNVGSIFFVIIPAMCKERGSPFGAPDVCRTYGLAYSSLSLAVSLCSLISSLEKLSWKSTIFRKWTYIVWTNLYLFILFHCGAEDRGFLPVDLRLQYYAPIFQVERIWTDFAPGGIYEPAPRGSHGWYRFHG